MRLIDADALGELLMNAIVISETMAQKLGIENEEYVQAELKAYKDILNGVKEMPTIGGWISVKDRLPEDTRFVLVCNDDKIIMVAQYIDETAQWQYPYIAYDVDVWDDDEQGPIMWWMPLPEPPEEVSA